MLRLRRTGRYGLAGVSGMSLTVPERKTLNLKLIPQNIYEAYDLDALRPLVHYLRCFNRRQLNAGLLFRLGIGKHFGMDHEPVKNSDEHSYRGALGYVIYMVIGLVRKHHESRAGNTAYKAAVNSVVKGIFHRVLGPDNRRKRYKRQNQQRNSQLFQHNRHL